MTTTDVPLPGITTIEFTITRGQVLDYLTALFGAVLNGGQRVSMETKVVLRVNFGDSPSED